LNALRKLLLAPGLLMTENGSNTTYIVNNSNEYQQVGNSTFRCDADGNLTNITLGTIETNMTWTPDNKLASFVAPNWTNGSSLSAALGSPCSMDSRMRVTSLNEQPSPDSPASRQTIESL
jgi:hypothetical protein